MNTKGASPSSISADSRQIYKHLNIGTAKPTLQELSEIKHHFIDFIELDGSYNAGQFAADAKNIITEIFKEHDVAIICGGTGLYIKALLDGIDNIPSSSPESRIKVNQLYQSGGLAALQEMLLKTDPVSFETLDIQNPRRISRALEVYFTTGSPLSQFKANQKTKHPFQITYLLLTQNRSALYAKIEKRVDEMIEKGLEEETRQYLEFKSNFHPVRLVENSRMQTLQLLQLLYYVALSLYQRFYLPLTNCFLMLHLL